MVTLGLTKEHEDKMNKLGNEGWELVGIYNTKNARNIMAIFKREKIE